MYTTKNPKSLNSFFDFNLIEVKYNEVIGHIVQYDRTTYNRYGGTNGWEIIQFIPVDEKYDLVSKESRLYKDLQHYEDLQVEQWFHMGERYGVEEQLFFVNRFNPIKVTLKNVTKSPTSWQKVIGKIILSWNGETQDVINDNIMITPEFVLFKENSGAYYVTKDSIKSSYLSKDILEKSFVLTKNDVIRIVSTEEEAPNVEYLEKPKRSRKRSL
jgi:hypothetical protein